MISEQFSRTEMLLGPDNMARLFTAKVAVFGVGGVGGACVEALARMGIGQLDLFDNDTVAVSNINRQIIATHNTVGQYKVEVMAARILSINPAAKVGAHRLFYLPETADQVDIGQYDYIVDAVDTVSAKLELVCRATAAGVPIISAMGAANKMDPTAFAVTDIYQTESCPLARVMRRELRKRHIPALKVVFSREVALTPQFGDTAPIDPDSARRAIPASNAFVPPVAGYILAGAVIQDLIAPINSPV